MSPEEKPNLEDALSTLAELVRVNSQRMAKSNPPTETPNLAQKELTEEKKLLIKVQEQLAEIQKHSQAPNISRNID
ncbi:MAG TPA: hypothetical protein VM095_20875 [Pyrinomonadaceae bacterium]|nr:hypothetical protein [Pyrinomonadaceae bacterium]